MAGFAVEAASEVEAVSAVADEAALLHRGVEAEDFAGAAVAGVLMPPQEAEQPVWPREASVARKDSGMPELRGPERRAVALRQRIGSPRADLQADAE